MNQDDVKLGISPIAWTNDDMPSLGRENTFQKTIGEIALAGFTGTEVGATFPRDPKILKPMLATYGIQICNAWFSTYFAKGQREKTIKDFIKHMNFLHEMGANIIGCSEQSRSIQITSLPILKNKPIFNDKEWSLTIRGYNDLATIASKKNMRVTLHHHMGTGIQTASEIDYFMTSTNNNVGLLYDTGHIYYSEGSQDALLSLLIKYLPRIFHIHLKDIRNNIIKIVRDKSLCFFEGIKKGIFTVPGDGIINFHPIFKILEEFKYKGWLIVEAEQDPCVADPFEYALKARNFIRATTGL